jgi:hypothetical protein
MGVRCNSLRLLPALLLNIFLLSALFAHAATEAYPLRIKVLTAETYAINGGTEVPKDCDLQNFSAYCNESKNPTSQTIMLVQDQNGKSFRIRCINDSRWSKCEPLAVGQTFDARQDKHGITIVSFNERGKERKQFFQLVAVVPTPQSATANPQSATAAPPPNLPAPAPVVPAAAAPRQSSPAPTPAAPAIAPRQVSQVSASAKVKCNFNSTPVGAEITVDWRYVGNTPSEIGLSPGTHVVVISMPGFAEWKRELTVGADSAVNVTASLQKTQP